MITAHRVFTRSPRYAATVVLTLAIGLAGVDTLLAVAGPVLLHPLPFPDAGSLYDVRVRAPDEDAPASVSHPGFLRLRGAAGDLATLGAYRPSDLTLTGPDGAEVIRGAVVTEGLAEALGVAFAQGRGFTSDEDRPGGPPVAVVSYGYWRTRLAGRADAVGATVAVDGVARTVVGVLDQGMAFPVGADLWLPLQNDDLRRGDRFRFLRVIARLHGGNGPTALVDALRRIPAADGSADVRPLVDALLGDVRGRIAALAVAIFTALLVVCINLGVLALVRALARRDDYVVRLALGAGRRRLALGVVAELGVLGALASALGWLGAVGAVHLGTRMVPPELLERGGLHVSAAVVATGAGLGLAAALVASILPLLTVPSSRLAGQLRRMGSGRRSARAFSALMAGQAALALVLCSTSLALVLSLARRSAVPLGFEARGLLEFQLGVGGPRYRSGEDRRRFLEGVETRLARSPGVTSVGAGLGTPLSSSTMTTGALVDGHQSVGEVYLQPASPGLVPTLERRILEGRGLLATDDRDGEPVALVNETLARSMWPGASALGHTVELEVEPGGTKGARTVVGVVSDVAGDLSGSRVPEVLIPYAQAAIPSVTVVVRTRRGGVLSLAAIRRAVAAVDPMVPVTRFAPVEAHRDRILRPLRLQTTVLVAFGLLSLGLILLNVYAVTSALVVRRQRELGIRIAVGCGPAALRLEVMRWALAPVLSGLAAGAVASGWGVGAMSSAAGGPVVLALPWILACAVCIAGLASAALLRPVRRAGRIPVTRTLAA